MAPQPFAFGGGPQPGPSHAPMDADALEQEILGAVHQYFARYDPGTALPASVVRSVVAALSRAFCALERRPPICGPGSFEKAVASIVVQRLLAVQEDLMRALPSSVAACARGHLKVELDSYMRRCTEAEASVGQLRAQLGAIASPQSGVSSGSVLVVRAPAPGVVARVRTGCGRARGGGGGSARVPRPLLLGSLVLPSAQCAAVWAGAGPSRCKIPQVPSPNTAPAADLQASHDAGPRQTRGLGRPHAGTGLQHVNDWMEAV
jgi:hypothetical protein